MISMEYIVLGIGIVVFIVLVIALRAWRYTKAGPNEIAVFIFPEPVNGKDAGRVRNFAAKIKPVVEVISHVVAAERQHSKRVAPNLSNSTCGGSGFF